MAKWLASLVENLPLVQFYNVQERLQGPEIFRLQRSQKPIGPMMFTRLHRPPSI
jgi:hypothetical protein